MVQDIPQYASEDLDQDHFCLQLTQWMENPMADPQDIQKITLSQEHQAHLGQHAHSKGLRGLFRSLRQKDTPWQRLFQDLRCGTTTSSSITTGSHTAAGR